MIKTRTLILFLSCFLFSNHHVIAQNGAKNKPHNKPNIILIMADDIGWESIGCYGSEDYKTPNIDRIAAGGIRFNHCYSTPICTTSRVKLMTGQYNFRNYTHFGYIHPSQKTFGHLLQQAGYRTAIAGKWQLNGLYNKMPRHLDSKRPQEAGFHESLLWQVTTGKGTSPKAGERFWNPPLEHNGKFITKEENQGKYGPDLFCDFICDFISRNQDQPFFVYYPMVLVHNPFVPTPDTIGNQSKDTANRAPKSRQQRKKNFGAMVLYMDKIVGRIEKKLKKTNQLENTILIFTADNGTNRGITSRWKGQMIQGGKAGLKDAGTHVPLVISWKGKTRPGQVCDDMVDFCDFYTTFGEIAGQKLPNSYPGDGHSFYPQLVGKPRKSRNWVLNHYQPYWNKKSGQFVRNQNYKLYRDGRLYSLPGDLHEENDLAKSDDQDIQAVYRELQAVIDRCPPVPYPPQSQKKLAGRNTKNRPVYPKWNLHSK